MRLGRRFLRGFVCDQRRHQFIGAPLFARCRGLELDHALAQAGQPVVGGVHVVAQRFDCGAHVGPFARRRLQVRAQLGACTFHGIDACRKLSRLLVAMRCLRHQATLCHLELLELALQRRLGHGQERCAFAERSLQQALVTQHRWQLEQRQQPAHRIAHEGQAGQFGQHITQPEATHARANVATLGRPAQVAEYLGLVGAGHEQMQLKARAAFVRVALEQGAVRVVDEGAMIEPRELGYVVIETFALDAVARRRLCARRWIHARQRRTRARRGRSATDFGLDRLKVGSGWIGFHNVGFLERRAIPSRMTRHPPLPCPAPRLLRHRAAPRRAG